MGRCLKANFGVQIGKTLSMIGAESIDVAVTSPTWLNIGTWNDPVDFTGT